MSQNIADFRSGRPFGDGTDGDLSISANTTFGAGTSCSGTSGTTTLTIAAAGSFADNDLVLIHHSRGTTGNTGGWEVNRIASGGGTTSLTLSGNLANTYTDSGADQSQVVRLLEYNDVTVDSGKTWSVPDWGGNTGGILAFAARGTTTITGNISANERGYDGGAAVAGDESSGATGYQGEGTAGTGSQATAANNGGGGGGQGNYDKSHFAGGGAGGGHSAAGAVGGTAVGSPPSTPGTAGSAIGDSADLTTASFGAGGGAGGSDWHDETVSGAGGNGSGLIFIFAKDITITGTMPTNGENGENGGAGSAGGGGGAGGAILIKAGTAVLGSGLLTATNGTGGTGGNGGDRTGNGGIGADGRIRCDYGTSVSGTTSPTLSSAQDTGLTETDGGMLMNLL